MNDMQAAGTSILFNGAFTSKVQKAQSSCETAEAQLDVDALGGQSLPRRLGEGIAHQTVSLSVAARKAADGSITDQEAAEFVDETNVWKTETEALLKEDRS